MALAAQGRTADALQAKRRAVELQPEDAEAQLNLAGALAAEGLDDAARAAYEAALRLDPAGLSAWSGLARLHLQAGRPAEAETCLRQRVALQPDSADAHNDLGNLLRQLHRMPDAEACFRRALALRPGMAAAANNLAATLVDLDRSHEAERWYREALAALPGQGVVWGNLGNLLKDLGRLGEAQECLRQCLALAPGQLAVHSNLLLALQHDPSVDASEALAEARRFGAAAQAAAGPALAPARRPRGAGPLRVGLVSGDLRQHPVGFFLESWLRFIDPARVALFAYPTVPREDAVTARLRPHFAGWQPLHGLHDEAAARRIAADGIDLLLDLSGHTAHNRLGMFAWRPAPVQASWLGYFATTGLPTMDWLLADRASIPHGGDSRFTEKLWLLPHTRLCFAAPADAPPVQAAPVLANGHITFGCFQALGKLHDGVLRCWARILEQVPGARLRLQNGQLGEPAVRQALAHRLADAGIAPERVEMHGKASRRAYLAAHGAVDLLLDTFPYPGGTTTCEALWMGVPTVTLQGDAMLSRQGAALLAAAGLPDFIAATRADYVSWAVAAAREPRSLNALRLGLRQRLPATPLFDGQGFARAMQDAWRQLCAA